VNTGIRKCVSLIRTEKSPSKGTYVKHCVRPKGLYELVVARGGDGDDLVTRKLGELDSELTDSGTPSVNEEPCLVGPFRRRGFEILS